MAPAFAGPAAQLPRRASPASLGFSHSLAGAVQAARLGAGRSARSAEARRSAVGMTVVALQAPKLGSLRLDVQGKHLEARARERVTRRRAGPAARPRGAGDPPTCEASC